jgi:hypothetical protein
MASRALGRQQQQGSSSSSRASVAAKQHQSCHEAAAQQQQAHCSRGRLAHRLPACLRAETKLRAGSAQACGGRQAESRRARLGGGGGCAGVAARRDLQRRSRARPASVRATKARPGGPPVSAARTPRPAPRGPHPAARRVRSRGATASTRWHRASAGLPAPRAPSPPPPARLPPPALRSGPGAGLPGPVDAWDSLGLPRQARAWPSIAYQSSTPAAPIAGQGAGPWPSFTGGGFGFGLT